MVEEDHCVYVKRSKKSFLILSLYVDDILLAGNDKEMIVTTKAWLSLNFKMQDMGEANYMLRVKIFRDRSRKFFGLPQETYIWKILKQFQMQCCKLINTPIRKGDTLSLDMYPKTQEKKKKKKMARGPYSSAIKSLMYTMMCTHLDICYVVGLVRRFQSNPDLAHWKAVKRVLQYFKGTTNYMLCYQALDWRLVSYSDGDYGGDLEHRKLTSTYAFLLSNCAISWSSMKQSCIALSTMESEYVACSVAVQEGVWLKRFIAKLGIIAHASELVTNPVIIHYNNMSTLAYAKDPKYHGKTKHIDI